ncbi:penicillin-binding transpeptidase domain-containing protein [Actinomycetes bacterium NPDC127524]
MMKKRIAFLACFIMLLLVLLAARLVQIQLISTESFSAHHVNLIEASVKQRTQTVTLDDGRGKFYDVKGVPLAHEEVPTLVLFPFLKKMDWPADKVAGIIGRDEEALKNAVQMAKEPFAFGGKKPIILTDEQTAAINSLKIPGVFAVKEKFNQNSIPAAQLIGSTVMYGSLKVPRYPDQKLSPETRVGYRGLQRTFDEFLISGGDSKLVYHVDANGGPMFGVDVKYVEPANPLYPVKVITTLDKGLQEKAEKLVDEHGIKKGGIVLIDIASSEIRAIVSRPSMEKRNPDAEGSVNLMFRQAAPGSVFKTVVAAAAIDYQAAKNKTFNCSLTIEGKKDKKHDYGPLNFENSFAQSCNRAFAELGQEISAKNPDFLKEYAEKLNVIGGSGWKGNVYHTPIEQLDQEDKGKIWQDEKLKKDPRMVAKSSIGQQDVQATPLAIANMMATIARGGEKEMVKAVKKVEFNNGTSIVSFPDMKISGKPISPYTALKLQQLLRGVVTSPKGTGAPLFGLPYEVAGKSGTAQTDIKRKRLNKWFAGYFPYKNPKYALVAVSLDTDEKSETMTPLFGDIVKEVYKEDQKQVNDGTKE